MQSKLETAIQKAFSKAYKVESITVKIDRWERIRITGNDSKTTFKMTGRDSNGTLTFTNENKVEVSFKLPRNWDK